MVGKSCPNCGGPIDEQWARFWTNCRECTRKARRQTNGRIERTVAAMNRRNARDGKEE